MKLLRWLFTQVTYTCTFCGMVQTIPLRRIHVFELNNLAHLLQVKKRLPEAEPLMRRAAEILERSLGADHPNTQTVRRSLDRLLGEIAGKGHRPRAKRRRDRI